MTHMSHAIAAAALIDAPAARCPEPRCGSADGLALLGGRFSSPGIPVAQGAYTLRHAPSLTIEAYAQRCLDCGTLVVSRDLPALALWRILHAPSLRRTTGLFRISPRCRHCGQSREYVVVSGWFRVRDAPAGTRDLHQPLTIDTWDEQLACVRCRARIPGFSIAR